MRQFITVLLIAIFIASTQFVCAQQCTGNLGAPAFSETFGHGTLYEPGPALPDGVTNLVYFYADCGGPDSGVPNHPFAGLYTLQSFMGPACKGATWQELNQDHTGDPHGYMMIINAGENPDVFFTETVPGSKLCPGTTYYFGAYIMNILRDLPSTQGYIEPNVTFNIRNAATKAIIKTINTGNLKATDLAKWIPEGTLFTSPADGSDVIIEMVNNAPGGNGNDLALDDITFSPCGPMVANGFSVVGDVTPRTACENTNVNYTLVSQQSGYDNPSYQWQFRNEPYGDWQNVTTTGAKEASLPLSIPNAAIGVYQYRVGVLAATSTSENCRIYSDPLTIYVYPDPVLKIDAATGGCTDYPVQVSVDVITVYPQDISVAGAPTFEWTGPNGFTSTESSPFISYNADPSLNGVYTVKVTKNGCSTFGHTTVTISLPTILSSTDDSIAVCEGDATQLSVHAQNATHYKWVPATGLDHDDVANPIANPKETTTYEVTVSNDGCPDVAPYADITVNVLKKPQAETGQGIKIFAGQSAKLNGTAKGDEVHYFWTPTDFLSNPSSLTPTAIPPQDITYTLHVVSNTTCGESTSNVFVRVYQLLTIPNTFTPNGDGVNDKWEIKNLITYPNALLSVYNRNGQLVFQNKGGSSAWDGTYNGSPLPVGTYYYVIDLQDGDLPKPSGWVLIVR